MPYARNRILDVNLGQIDAVVLRVPRKLLDESELESRKTQIAAIRQAVIDQLRTMGQAPEPRRIRAETATALALAEVQDTLQVLAATGSSVCYRSVDITDGDAVRSAVAAFRAEWGPITGVIHGAGVLADYELGVAVVVGHVEGGETCVEPDMGCESVTILRHTAYTILAAQAGRMWRLSRKK